MSENFENKAVRGSISQIILKALSKGDKYGYEICKDIEKLTDGKLILKQPSLYSSLRRMEEQNLISSYWKDSLIGGRRHYYSITQKGKDYFEENKKYWQEDESILNNLPQKEFDNNTSTNFSTSSQTTEHENNNTHSTFVVNQENLFNLKTNKEIKKIDAVKAEQNDEFNKSFFQFDFFDQNIKLVKGNSVNKQEISAFTNRFSEMDNHKEEIEPVKQPNTYNKNISAFINSKQEDNKNMQELDKDEETDKSSYEIYVKKSIHYQPVLKNSFVKIERDEVYNNSIVNNISSELKLNSTIQNNSPAPFNEDVVKQENNNNFNSFDDNFNYNSQEKNKVSLEDINYENNKNTSVEEISWDFETNVADDNSLFEANDYKDIIGKLYNNSRLQDPYEQNKFQTFKEIFPSSQFKTKAPINNIELEETNNVMISDNNNQVEAYIKSNQESNIDCEDIKKLNSLYNLQGINIKIHNSSECKKSKKTYTDKNKLNMICGWATSIIMILEILIAFILLRNNNLIIGKQPYIYFLGIALALNYCIICSLENIFDRFKLIVINKSFKKMFMQRLFAFIMLVIVIFAVNVIFGMTSLTEIKYLSYWLVPLILASNLLISCFIYHLLLKSKNFNS